MLPFLSIQESVLDIYMQNLETNMSSVRKKCPYSGEYCYKGERLHVVEKEPPLKALCTQTSLAALLRRGHRRIHSESTHGLDQFHQFFALYQYTCFVVMKNFHVVHRCCFPLLQIDICHRFLVTARLNTGMWCKNLRDVLVLFVCEGVLVGESRRRLSCPFQLPRLRYISLL